MSKPEKSGRKSGVPSEEPRSWEDINQSLACLGEADRQIRFLRDQFDQKVAVLKQQLLEATEPVTSEKDRLQRQLEIFYWAHRHEVLMQGRKSVDLAFGRLGSRSSRGLVVEDAAAAEQWLRHNGLSRYLRVRSDLDREALRSVLVRCAGSDPDGAAAQLAACPGIRLRESEEFWYEVDTARLGAPAPASVPNATPRTRGANPAHAA